MISLPCALGSGQAPIFGAPLISQILAFALLMFLLVRFAFPFIRQMLDRRTSDIRTQFDTLDRDQSGALAETASLRRALETIHEESQRRMNSATEEGRRLGVQSLAEARKQAEFETAKARREIQMEQDKAVLELRSLLAKRILEVTDSAVASLVDERLQQKLVDRSVQELARTVEPR